MAKPSAVSSKLIITMISMLNPIADGVMRTPTRGPKTRKMIPCTAASVAPPSTFPKTMDERLTGAASTDSRNPSLRSWISDIMLKMAVKSTIMATDPGKK